MCALAVVTTWFYELFCQILRKVCKKSGNLFFRAEYFKQVFLKSPCLKDILLKKTTSFISTVFCTSYKIIISFTNVANCHKLTIFCLQLVILYVTVWQYSADPIALCMCRSSRDKILHGCTCISQNQNNEDDEIWLKLAYFLLQKVYEINWKYGLFVFSFPKSMYLSQGHTRLYDSGLFYHEN